MWYQWDAIESFNLWHNNICATLGIPNAQTLDYTKPVEVKGKFIAVVHQNEAIGLVATSLRPPKLVLN